MGSRVRALRLGTFLGPNVAVAVEETGEGEVGARGFEVVDLGAASKGHADVVPSVQEPLTNGRVEVERTSPPEFGHFESSARDVDDDDSSGVFTQEILEMGDVLGG